MNHASADILAAVLTASPHATAMIDSQGMVEMWNPAAERLFGAARGGPLPVALPAAAGELSSQTRHFTVDFGTSVLEVDTAPAAGGAVIVFTDVTAQRRAEQQFRAVFEQAPIGMAVADLDGHLLEVNASFRRILELVEPGVEAMRWEDFLEPGQPARNLSRLLGGIGTGQAPALQTDARFRTRSGRLIDVQWNLCMVTGADGQPVCQIGQLADISRRKAAEKNLKHYAQVLDQSNQDLQQFAYAASHDLQEPLRMVRSYLELLARRYKGKLDADADEFIGYAVDGAVRMQKLISGLLAYSRVGTEGKEFRTVAAEPCFRTALENLRVAIEEAGAQVSADPLPAVFADEVQVTQLFQNLIGNSIKFRSETAPGVHVSAHREGATWRFVVKDNGIGLDPKFSDRAFQIFQRLQPAHRYAGTGIGLALCKRIVERHGGRIGVDSAPGEGASFWFTLPAVPVEAVSP